ncbi:MAG TPA: WD40 repeat domain-containing protein [Methanoregulaceae archaeon]|nr:WD40 repeat domain-containing protein [Methanoregulaceae archaeon]
MSRIMYAIFLAGILTGALIQIAPLAADTPDWHYFVDREYIYSIDISSDGEIVAAGTTMGKVLVFDKVGTLLWDYRVPGRIIVDVSPDGSIFIVSTQDSAEKNKGTVRCFDRNGTQLWMENTGWVTNIDFSKNLDTIAVGTRDGDIIILDSLGTVMETYTDFPKTYVVNSLSLSQDGSCLAYSLFEDKPNLEYIDLDASRRRIFSKYSVKYSWPINIIRISGDGNYIATESSEGSYSELSFFSKNGIRIWSRSLKKLNDIVITVNGSRIVTGSKDGTLSVFNSSGNQLWNFTSQGEITSISMNDGEDLIAVGSAKSILYLFTLSGDHIRSFRVEGFPEGRIQSVKLSNDGGSIIAAVNKKELIYISLLPKPKVSNPSDRLNLPVNPLDATPLVLDVEPSKNEDRRFKIIEIRNSLWNISRIITNLV